MIDNTPLLPEMAELWQQSLAWQPTQSQQQQFQRLYELILSGNRQLNLTRIVDPLEFWEKHLWDSLRGIAPLFRQGEKLEQVIDIGTGAGFPGVPVAITLPDWQVTLLDSTQKKITFLKSLLAEMGIANANTITGRAEVIGKQPQHQTYSIALVRAVGSASVCVEYALPLLQPGGLAILYRGHWTADEATALEKTLIQLGGALETIEDFTTPLTHSMRHCLYIRKTVKT